MLRVPAGVLLVGLLVWQTQTAMGESYTLEEPTTDTRSFQVRAQVTVEGKLKTALTNGQQLSLPLNVNANLHYEERRLPGRGRDAQSLRSLRFYSQADAAIKVRDESISSRLREAHRLLVAQGERRGLTLYSPRGPLTFTETELINYPGDSLTVLGLLPPTTVEVGDKWSPESWAIQMLIGVEAVLKSELQCELLRIDNGQLAIVKFSGSLEGANLGASTKVEFQGAYRYDLTRNCVTRLELTQTDKREVGTVSPGMDVTAKVVLTREPLTTTAQLSESLAKQIPLNPADGWFHLQFDSPWNSTFRYTRDWHVFKQTGSVAVFRLLENGSLVAQFNVSPMTAAPPGKHLDEKQFQVDIQKALGDTLKSVDRAEKVPTSDNKYIYAVQVSGKANEIEMTWIYYLCAAPSGEQLVFVFAIETKLADQLKGRDLELVKSVTFKRSGAPEAASRE